MPVWPLYLAYVAGLFALSRRAGDAMAIKSLAWVCFGLLLMQAWKPAGLGEYIWLASAATWAFVAGAVMRIVSQYDANPRQAVTICLSLIGVSLCYFWGRFAGAAFGPGAHLFASDMLGLIACTAIGGRGIGTAIRDIARMGALVGGGGGNHGDVLCRSSHNLSAGAPK